MRKLNGYWHQVRPYEWHYNESRGWLSVITKTQSGYHLQMSRDVGSIRDGHRLTDKVIEATCEDD